MENIENMTEALPMLDNSDARALAEAIAEVLDFKKGKDIKVLHVEDKTVIAEYFVICSGNTGTQVKALAGEVEYKIGLRGVDPYQVEGRDNNSWVVLDFCNVLVHIFNREARDFYNLDKLYGDSSTVSVSTED